jgi:hypothetical protein
MANAQKKDNWYIISLGEIPVGYYHETTDILDNQIITGAQLSMKISRLGSIAKVESEQSFVEDIQGKLISISSNVLLSNDKSLIKAKIEPGNVILTNSIGGKETSNNIPYTGDLFGYEGARMKSLAGLKKEGDSISYKTFIPEYGLVVICFREYLSQESVEVNGKFVESIKVRDSYIGLPTTRISWLDRECNLLKSSEPNPFGQMTLLKSDQKSAIALSNSTVELSEDQYSGTVAKSNVRLPQARNIESVTIRIKHKLPELGFPDFSGTYQTVTNSGNDEVILKITRPEMGGSIERLSTANKEQFLKSTAFLNLEDTLIIKYAKEITGKEMDPWKKAILIRNWVNKNMKFNPGIVMAPSEEIIRNMEGTCVSFATITTTLCRAAGIPARYLMGYVYVDGIWGGHAWAEVYINNSWLPIDAAVISPSGIADAARFYFIRSSVSNGLGECMIGGSQLYANIDVEILEYKLEEKTYKPKEKLYTFNDKIYSNPGLGILMKAFNGFEFKDMDRVYPDNLLFSLRNPSNGESVEVYQEFIAQRSDLARVVKLRLNDNKLESKIVEANINGCLALRITSDEKSLMAISNGLDVFVLIAKGTDSEDILNKALSGFEFQTFKNIEE